MKAAKLSLDDFYKALYTFEQTLRPRAAPPTDEDLPALIKRILRS